jgi:hypothetical protein
MILADSIVEKIHCMGGRFLIQNAGPFEPQWRLMTKVEARRKTSQALREARELQWTHKPLVDLSYSSSLYIGIRRN